MKLPAILILLCCMTLAEAASLTSDRYRAAPGVALNVELADFLPGETVELYFRTTRQAELAVDGAGELSATLYVPADAALGAAWVEAVGRSSGERAQAPLFIETRWAQQGFGSDHKQYNPHENQLSASNIHLLMPHWSRRVNCSLYSPVVVAYGFVFVNCRVTVDVGLSALHESSGNTHWTVIGAPTQRTSMAVSNGKIFVSTSPHRRLEVFDAKRGTLLWSRLVPGELVAAPVISGDRLFLATRSGYLSSFDSDTGNTTHWSRSIGFGLSVVAAPAVAGGILYVGAANDQSLRALDAQSGELLWSQGVGGNLPASPVVGNGKVYVPATDGNLYAFDAQDGSPRWVVPIGYEAEEAVRQAQSPALANGVLYMATPAGTLRAIRASDGKILWTAGMGSRMFALPVVANGMVYVGTEDGRLRIFDTQSGMLLHSLQLGDGREALNALVVSNGRVLVSAGRSVHALGLPIPLAGPQPQPHFE